MEKMTEDLTEWQAQSHKPVLVADLGNWCATQMNLHRTSGLALQKQREEDYVKSVGESAQQK